MLKKLYDKSKLWFSCVWIIAYCVLMSAGDSISVFLGVDKSVTLAVGIVLSTVLISFLKKNSLFEFYGICYPKVSAKSMLYYIPLIAMIAVNCWYGLTFNYGAIESVLHVLSMLCVGFLEEIIFRGLLFESMRKYNVKTAIIVSSVTFGIGHIINLFNGSGTELLPNLLQVVYATSAGFMFVMMYYKSKSLIACIVAHGLFNVLSVFSDEANVTQEMRIFTAILLTVITGGYAIYITLTMKKENYS